MRCALTRQETTPSRFSPLIRGGTTGTMRCHSFARNFEKSSTICMTKNVALSRHNSHCTVSPCTPHSASCTPLLGLECIEVLPLTALKARRWSRQTSYLCWSLNAHVRCSSREGLASEKARGECTLHSYKTLTKEWSYCLNFQSLQSIWKASTLSIPRARYRHQAQVFHYPLESSCLWPLVKIIPFWIYFFFFFIDLIYFHFRLLCETTSTSAKRIAWVIDGLDEVVSRNDALLGVVIDALEKITQSSNIEAPISRADHRIELFGSHDIIVITSREERGGALAGAQLVATINPWTTTEALEYVGNYFKQRAVRDVILAGSCSTQSSLNSNASELVALCMKRATSAIHEHRFGSFSTLPIVLEILCWSALEEDGRMGCIADLYHDTFVKTIAAARENSSSSPLSSPTTTPAWTSSDEEIFTLHNEKAVEATQDGVFFTINRTHPCGRDLFRSGLVRERIGAKHDRTIVRFAHKSFLEYFQAAFFAEHLDQLQTKLAHVDVATPSGSDEESSVSFLACTVRDDFTMIKNNSHQMDVIVDMTLYCAWEPAIVCEILWLEGAGEKAASDATKDKTFGRYRPPSRAGSVGGEWRTSVKLKFRSVTKTYYLVVRPTSGK